MTIHDVFSHPATRGAIAGVLAAAAVDIHAFVTSPNWRVVGFNWGMATKRWFTGAITGAASALGLGYLL